MQVVEPKIIVKLHNGLFSFFLDSKSDTFYFSTLITMVFKLLYLDTMVTKSFMAEFLSFGVYFSSFIRSHFWWCSGIDYKDMVSTNGFVIVINKSWDHIQKSICHLECNYQRLVKSFFIQSCVVWFIKCVLNDFSNIVTCLSSEMNKILRHICMHIYTFYTFSRYKCFWGIYSIVP